MKLKMCTQVHVNVTYVVASGLVLPQVVAIELHGRIQVGSRPVERCLWPHSARYRAIRWKVSEGQAVATTAGIRAHRSVLLCAVWLRCCGCRSAGAARRGPTLPRGSGTTEAATENPSAPARDASEDTHNWCRLQFWRWAQSCARACQSDDFSGMRGGSGPSTPASPRRSRVLSAAHNSSHAGPRASLRRRRSVETRRVAPADRRV